MLRVQREARRDAKHVGFPFQVEAVEAAKGLEYAALFHEQGLGKTKIAIDLALSWLQQGDVDSVLIVTKKGLVANWRSEIKTHSYLTPRVLGQNRKDNFFAFNSPARVYLTHYEVCLSEVSRLQLFLKTRRVGVICDEAQKFKNRKTAVTKSLFRLRHLFTRRVILTGTPIANRPFDIWSLIYFLDGGKSLGADFHEFRRGLELSGESLLDESDRDILEELLAGLFEKLSAFCIRETKQSAGINLPTKTIENVLVDAEAGQEEIYKSYKNELRAIVVRSGVPKLDEAEGILKRLLRLVQVASNPALVDQSYHAIPGKLDALTAILDDRLGNDVEKAIVWTTFTENADWLSRQLKTYGAIRLHGKMSMEDRNRAVTRFKSDPDVKVLVATPGAAKEGLTLTVANLAVFFDRSFSLDDYLQAQDRIHRISQTRPCYVYNLIMRGTADEWVDELLSAKHLAARLGVGDIDREDYRRNADYGFIETLGRILGRLSENDDES